MIISAIFSGAEAAILSIDKVKLSEMADKGIRIAEKILKLRIKRENTVTTILIVNNLVNIAATFIATNLADEIAARLNINAGVWVIPIMTVVIVIVGEMIPKTAAQRKPYPLTKLVYYPLFIATIICIPLVWLAQNLTNGILWLFHVKPDPHDLKLVSEEDLEAMIDASHREGIIPSEEKAMIERVFEFGDTTVREIMVARVDMKVASIDAKITEIMKVFTDSGHSRLPVFDGNTDNIKGIIHIKDIIPYLSDTKNGFDIRTILRKPYFVPETKRISELFKEMRLLHVHIAIAVDEYGGVAGLITLEDLLEELVGEIQDEYDFEDDDVVKLDDKSYIMVGDMEIEDVNKFLGTEIEDDEYDTLAGFLMEKLGHLGKIGERVEYEGIVFIIVRVDKLRITKVRVMVDREVPELRE